MPIYATKRAWNCFFDRPADGSDGDCGWRSESVLKWPAPITIHFYTEVGFRNRLDDALARLSEFLGYEFDVVDASDMSMFDRNNYNDALDPNSILVELRDDEDVGGNRLGYAEWWVYRSRHEFSVARVVVAGQSSNLNATIMHEMVHALTGMGRPDRVGGESGRRGADSALSFWERAAAKRRVRVAFPLARECRQRGAILTLTLSLIGRGNQSAPPVVRACAHRAER